MLHGCQALLKWCFYTYVHPLLLKIVSLRACSSKDASCFTKYRLSIAACEQYINQGILRVIDCGFISDISFFTAGWHVYTKEGSFCDNLLKRLLFRSQNHTPQSARNESCEQIYRATFTSQPFPCPLSRHLGSMLAHSRIWLSVLRFF